MRHFLKIKSTLKTTCFPFVSKQTAHCPLSCCMCPERCSSCEKRSSSHKIHETSFSVVKEILKPSKGNCTNAVMEKTNNSEKYRT